MFQNNSELTNLISCKKELILAFKGHSTFSNGTTSKIRSHSSVNKNKENTSRVLYSQTAKISNGNKSIGPNGTNFFKENQFGIVSKFKNSKDENFDYQGIPNINQIIEESNIQDESFKVVIQNYYKKLG